jgi:hypothetical protein
MANLKNGQQVYARLARIVPTNEDRGDQERSKAKEYEEAMKADVVTKDKFIKRRQKKDEGLPKETQTQETKNEVEEKPKRRRSPRKRQGGDE